MRVLAITPLYPPSSLVGAWLATHSFMRDLVQRGHEVTVSPYIGRAPGYVLDGVKVAPSFRGRTHTASLARFADVVVAHAGGDEIAVDAAKTAGVPLVVMVHGAGHTDLGPADLHVFNSESLQADHVGPSIVCHPPTSVTDHQTHRFGSSVTVVNCSAAKGIKTVWRCADRMPDHEFLGVTGGYGHQIKPRALNFKTIPTQRDMRGVWERTRVLCAPSLYETWGMVGVEAMANGIPVIAHPTPGMRESLGDAGIFVDRDDTDGWVETIRSLDNPDVYAEASQKSLSRFEVLEAQFVAGFDRFARALETLCGF